MNEPDDEPRYEPSLTAKVVGGAQWAATGYTVVAAVLGAVSAYSIFVLDSVETGVLTTLGFVLFAGLVASLPGGFAVGYLWARFRTMTAEAGRVAHRKRATYLVLLLVFWVATTVLQVLLSGVLGDRYTTVPFFLLPSAFIVGAVVVAYWLAYVRGIGLLAATAAEGTNGRPRRPSLVARLVGGVQWSITALYLGFLGFLGYGYYLTATEDSFSLDPALEITAAVVLAFAAGFAWAGRMSDDEPGRRHRRRLSSVVLLVGLVPIVGLVLAPLSLLSAPTGDFLLLTLFPVALFSLVLLVSFSATYGLGVDVVGRLYSP